MVAALWQAQGAGVVLRCAESVLLVGVLVFVFYTFNPAPMIFGTEIESRLRTGQQAQALGAPAAERRDLKRPRLSQKLTNRLGQ